MKELRKKFLEEPQKEFWEKFLEISEETPNGIPGRIPGEFLDRQKETEGILKGIDFSGISEGIPPKNKFRIILSGFSRGIP